MIIMNRSALTMEVEGAGEAPRRAMGRGAPEARLARNTLWNLGGRAAPMVVAIVAIPILIEYLGTERFGILTLAWILIGYFNMFDLGLGRALTKLVAERLDSGRATEVGLLTWTGLLAITTFGLIGAATIAALAPTLVYRILKIPAELQPETLTSFYLLGLALPFAICATASMGVLEAYGMFGLTNLGRIILGIYMYLAPLVVLPFSRSLVPLVALILAGRIATCAAFLFLCSRSVPLDPSGFALRISVVKSLLHFGGWMTVSNVVSPLLVYLDRLLIGALFSASAVAYYATPFEAITKLTIISSALSGVLFREFAVQFARDRGRAAMLFDRGLRGLQLVIFPLILVVVTLAPEILGAWLNDEFARNSTRIIQWLAVGVLLNCLASLPFALIQSAGRPDLTAKVHLVELPVFIFVLWQMVLLFGIRGAAFAWACRMAMDYTLLRVIAGRFLGPRLPRDRWAAPTAVAAFGLLLAGATIPGLIPRAIFLMSTLAIYLVAAWGLIPKSGERAILCWWSAGTGEVTSRPLPRPRKPRSKPW
jgi:O-antigen/teichoic acid export membrane protein